MILIQILVLQRRVEVVDSNSQLPVSQCVCLGQVVVNLALGRLKMVRNSVAVGICKAGQPTQKVGISVGVAAVGVAAVGAAAISRVWLNSVGRRGPVVIVFIVTVTAVVAITTAVAIIAAIISTIR